MGSFNKHLVIVGSARSGTSWLSELIASQFRYRMLFEPEHEFNTEKGQLICDQWLQNKNDSPEAYKYLNRIFQNRVDSDWIGQISNRKYKMHLWPFIPKKYIIKFVRANLSAKFINENFEIPVIHIIRNPYDTLASQQRAKFPWLYNLDHFKKQKDLVDILKAKFNFDLVNDTEEMVPIETLTVRWCLENIIPLKAFEPYQYKHHILKYEDLRDDLQLFLDLCMEFNIKPLENIESEYQRPSSKTHPRSDIRNKNAKKLSLAPEELKSINNLLDIFKCTLYPRRES